eukprot:gene5734-6023_t
MLMLADSLWIDRGFYFAALLLYHLAFVYRNRQFLQPRSLSTSFSRSLSLIESPNHEYAFPVRLLSAVKSKELPAEPYWFPGNYPTFATCLPQVSAPKGFVLRATAFGLAKTGSIESQDAFTNKEALSHALLETVRLVLKQQESEEGERGVKYGRKTGGSHLELEEAGSDESDELDLFHHLPSKKSNNKSGVPGGPCSHCRATESPQWRRPLTRNAILCNACGIFYSRHHSLPKRKKTPPQLSGIKDAGDALLDTRDQPQPLQL